MKYELFKQQNDDSFKEIIDKHEGCHLICCIFGQQKEREYIKKGSCFSNDILVWNPIRLV